uniref:uncharacterized protein LOC100175594 isoform X2 n=1 Tax=Ciona intestinalis TaxID=7719 RepID=UPI00089DD2D2|nr:uncharacterized protein LOC100175594 isoform X2 [Ciona intestinalis]|eukprot:XP_018671306.1 uncharacterized protein LOC100175594 isoform X2 [Ciona intestinalis]
MASNEPESLTEAIDRLTFLFGDSIQFEEEKTQISISGLRFSVVVCGQCIHFVYSEANDLLQVNLSQEVDEEIEMQRKIDQILLQTLSGHWLERVTAVTKMFKSYFKEGLEMGSENMDANEDHIEEHCSSQKSATNLPLVSQNKKGKKPPMKTALDVINRIKWDAALDPHAFTVAYEDRFKGTIEKGFSEFDWENDISSVGPDILSIPQHRIQYFKYKSRVVWDKKERIDHVFGSAGGRLDIMQVMLEEKAMEMRISDMNENAEDDLQDKMEQKPSHSRAGRPSHFIGIRIGQRDIQNRIGHLQQELLKCLDTNDRTELKGHLTPLCKLHITLCVCELNTDTEIEKTKQVMQKLSQTIKPFKVTVTNTDNFNETVLFAKPHSQELGKLNNQIMEALQQENINLTGNFQKFVPHITIYKVSAAKKYLFPKIKGFLPKKQKFGFQQTTELVLCKFGTSEVQSDGFYPVFGTFPLASDLKGHGKWKRHPMAWNDATANKVHQTNTSTMEKHEQHFMENSGAPKRRRGKKYDTIVGISLSSVLRHNKYGFKVDKEGYVPVDAILKHQHFKKLGLTREEMHRIVRENDKQRFTIQVNEDGMEIIKANQGHSVEVSSLNLMTITDACEFHDVIHGTFWTAWKSIRKQGLHCRKRMHIHMTTAEPNSDQQVISGMRYSCNVFVHIDMGQAIKDGIPFFLSENKVILSPGDKNGYLRPKYFRKVEGISNGKRITLLGENIHKENLIIEDIIEAMLSKVEEEEIKSS